MARYDDVTRAGRSRLVPYREGERAQDRHHRRAQRARRAHSNMADWCAALGVRLTVHNRGHHWRFVLPDGRGIDWWPSSAKLVIQQRWRDGVHVHDYHQVKQIIAGLVKGEGEPDADHHQQV